MSHYKYVIIGGGMAAASAVSGIREVDRDNEIALFSTEPDPPYDRPPLTKGLWKGASEAKIWRKFQEGVELHVGYRIKEVDATARRIVDDRGKSHTFEKLLMATGGRPHQLPFASPRIIYFRTLADYRQLRELAEQYQRFAIVGGGFIGSEIAAALATNGKEVVIVTRGEYIGHRVFPKELGLSINNFYRQKGVEVRTRESVVGVKESGKHVTLVTRRRSSMDDYSITADAIVAGIGIKPNVEVAKTAGLDVDNGIIVDDFLRTNRADIFAAGDVACFPERTLRRYRRVEHEDNANRMGLLAGRNMAGEREPYQGLPFFYSDLFDLGYEAVGETISSYETRQDWVEPGSKGVIYYFNKQRLRGLLMWNVWGKVDIARRLIARSHLAGGGKIGHEDMIELTA